MTNNVIQKSCLVNGIYLNYYEIKNHLPVLIMIHAQGTNAMSYKDTFKDLSKKYHIYAVDCLGHGKSDKNKNYYNIASIGDTLLDFFKNIIGEEFYIIGHSSGGLIASYIASKTPMCLGLILEDPPLFSCQGKRRLKTFNYLDLSTVCHNYIEEKIAEDFVVYYFKNQKMWEFFPDKSREKIKTKLVKSVINFRRKHPDKPLKVPFFPKSALEAYRGMNEYDPYFGDSFYNDTFHNNILHSEILKQIACKTLLMKATTNFDDKGILLAAMNDDDLNLAQQLIGQCDIVKFDCGHGIHIEKKREFTEAIIDFAKQTYYMERGFMIGKEVTVTIDRPLNSVHPKHKDTIYPINYGYIENIFAPDGEEQDVYILGVDVPITTFTGVIIAIIHRNDDVEEKWVVAPKDHSFTLEEVRNATYFTEQYYDSQIHMK